MARCRREGRGEINRPGVSKREEGSGRERLGGGRRRAVFCLLDQPISSSDSSKRSVSLPERSSSQDMVSGVEINGGFGVVRSSAFDMVWEGVELPDKE